MSQLRYGKDPLWQCLCPSWYSQPALRAPSKRLYTTLAPPTSQARRNCFRLHSVVWSEREHRYRRKTQLGARGIRSETIPTTSWIRPAQANSRVTEEKAVQNAPTAELYTRLRSLAVKPEAYDDCHRLVSYLVYERRQQPNLQLYNALILSNISHEHGSAAQVRALLAEIHAEDLQIETSTCHAVLKVLAVHPDHLLRTDILEYMRAHWFQISSEGAHDVTAGLLREGLYEQAVMRLDAMKQAGIHVEAWLVDMAIYQLCDSGDIEEAYRIMRERHERMEVDTSRVAWFTMLDRASADRHHAATKMTWTHRVRLGYLNPPVGICLNVLITASKHGDIELATDAFTRIVEKGLAHHKHHYDLMMSTYLSGPRPDIGRALGLLCVMESENLTPGNTETRGLFTCLRQRSVWTERALPQLRALHTQGRKIPIAALNLLIELFIDQANLPQAMKVYKSIHTFGTLEEGRQRTSANIDTINILLKGCRTAEPPDENLASFLVSEMFALGIQPNELTYDRLILVSIESCLHNVATGNHSHGKDLLNWAYKHLQEMRATNLAPRQGTLHKLATVLASQSDERCWDVLQLGEENAHVIDGWKVNSGRIRTNVENAWSLAHDPCLTQSDEGLPIQGKAQL